MIQRIQTLYLLISVVVSAVLIFVFHLWTTMEDVKVFASDDYLYLSLFLVGCSDNKTETAFPPKPTAFTRILLIFFGSTSVS